MPKLPAAPGVLKVTLSGTIQGKPWAVVQHTKYSGAAPTVAQLQTYWSTFSDAYNTNIVPLAHSSVILTKIGIVDLSSETGSAFEGASNLAGTRAGTANPSQVCCVSSWHVNLRYRGGHARSYWPVGVNADILNGFQWQTAFITAANAAFTAWRTALNAALINSQPVPMVMLSYYSGRALRPQPISPLIDSVKVRNRIDTQRRRLGKSDV